MNDNKLKRLLFIAFDEVSKLSKEDDWQFGYSPYRRDDMMSVHESWMLHESFYKIKSAKPQLAKKLELVRDYAVCSYFAFELYETIAEAAVILMKKNAIDRSDLDDPYFTFLNDIQYKYDIGVEAYIHEQRAEAYSPHVNINLVIQGKAYLAYRTISEVLKKYALEQIDALVSFIQSWLGNFLDEMSIVKIVRAACIVIMSKHSNVIDFEGYGLAHCRRMLQQYIKGGLRLSRNIAVVIEKYGPSKLPNEQELINEFLRSALPSQNTNIVKIDSPNNSNWLAPGKGGAISDKSVDVYTFGMGDTPPCETVMTVIASDPFDRNNRTLRLGFRLALQKKG